MNKLASAVILLAFVAVASGKAVDLESSEQFDELSEFKIKPDDDGETAFLADEHKVFADFCIQSRDEVYSYIQNKNQEVVANIFATFFGSISEVTEQLEVLQKEEAEKATKAIREGLAPVSEGEELTKEETEARLEKSASLLASIGGALANYARALANAATQEFLTRLSLLKKTANSENFKDALTNTCNNIQLLLLPKLQTLFKETKAEIAKEGGKDVADMLAQATFEKVGCLTTGRARKVVNVCKVFTTAGPMMFSMMGI